MALLRRGSSLAVVLIQVVHGARYETLGLDDIGVESTSEMSQVQVAAHDTMLGGAPCVLARASVNCEGGKTNPIPEGEQWIPMAYGSTVQGCGLRDKEPCLYCCPPPNHRTSTPSMWYGERPCSLVSLNGVPLLNKLGTGFVVQCVSGLVYESVERRNLAPYPVSGEPQNAEKNGIFQVVFQAKLKNLSDTWSERLQIRTSERDEPTYTFSPELQATDPALRDERVLFDALSKTNVRISTSSEGSSIVRDDGSRMSESLQSCAKDALALASEAKTAGGDSEILSTVKNVAYKIIALPANEFPHLYDACMGNVLQGRVLMKGGDRLTGMWYVAKGGGIAVSQMLQVTLHLMMLHYSGGSTALLHTLNHAYFASKLIEVQSAAAIGADKAHAMYKQLVNGKREDAEDATDAWLLGQLMSEDTSTAMKAFHMCFAGSSSCWRPNLLPQCKARVPVPPECCVENKNSCDPSDAESCAVTKLETGTELERLARELMTSIPSAESFEDKAKRHAGRTAGGVTAGTGMGLLGASLIMLIPGPHTPFAILLGTCAAIGATYGAISSWFTGHVEEHITFGDDWKQTFLMNYGRFWDPASINGFYEGLLVDVQLRRDKWLVCIFLGRAEHKDQVIVDCGGKAQDDAAKFIDDEREYSEKLDECHKLKNVFDGARKLDKKGYTTGLQPVKVPLEWVFPRGYKKLTDKFPDATTQLERFMEEVRSLPSQH